MGFFYFDESTHEKGGFTLGAFVYSERSLDGPVSEALRASDLVPYVDEFKSGSRMDRHPEQVRARYELRGVFRSLCRVGVIVAAVSTPGELGLEALMGLEKIISANRLSSDSHDVFFDEGTFLSEQAGHRAVSQRPTLRSSRFFFEQDSVEVPGLQVADLLAHSCAMMLLTELGLINKTVKAGENSGFDPDLDVSLDFELNANLRHHFFSVKTSPDPRLNEDFWFDVESRGLHVAENCDASLKRAALSRFGRMFLGCIH
jgi:hypothetical protein